MKLQAVKNAVTSKVGRSVLTTQKHAPALLFGAGVVGVVASGVLACKATLKLEDILEETTQKQDQARTLVHREYSEADRAQDLRVIKIQAAAQIVKLYGPAILVGAASIAALTGSHVVMNRRYAGVVAAYSALNQGFEEYRSRVREQYGDEKDEELRYGTHTVTETVVDKKGNSKSVEKEVLSDGKPSIYARWFDEQSDQWTRNGQQNSFFLKCQQNYWNDRLNSRGHVFLNEVYDALGFERCTEGAVVGWLKNNPDGDGFIDFGIFEGDNIRTRMFVNGNERTILVDFNVDGTIFDKI